MTIMTPALPRSVIDESQQLPLACIIAQEEDFILPLREYLETNGCQVHINAPSISEAIYIILAGDAEYVKRILATENITPLRYLIMIVNGTVLDAQSINDPTKKIVIVDPKYLSVTDIEEIFSFFFSGNTTLLNKRRNGHEQGAPYDAPEENVDHLRMLNETVAPRLTDENKNDLSLQKEISPDDITVLSTTDQKRINTIMTDVFGDERQNKKRTHRSHLRKRITHYFRSGVMPAIVALSIIVFPIMCYIFSIFITTVAVAGSGFYLLNGDSAKSSLLSSASTYWLTQSEIVFSFIRVPSDLAGKQIVVRGQERYISFLSDIRKSIASSQSVFIQGKQLSGSLLSVSEVQDETTHASQLEELRISVVSVHESLGLAEAELSILIRDRSFPFNIPLISTYGDIALSKITSARDLFAYAQKLMTVYPRISGFRSSQSYLVLFQNSSELRPTGGFIGSVGLATLENGALSEFSIEDVYALDGQLKGHVDPPKPIAELLGQEHWYLRDSNWSPDFKESAARAAWFYEKETGKKVDGVIGINIPVIVGLLKATGPITLPDYNDRITEENFFGKSLYYTQSNFFPGSTQKRDFLGSLARAIITKITSDKDTNLIGLFKALTDGIAQRDVQVQFMQSDLQSLIEYYGWGGRVYASHDCPGVVQANCLMDPLLLSESNMSVSKVNNFIHHSGLREIVLSPEGEISESFSYTIQNAVSVLNDPNLKGVGGPYQAYIRFILPKDSLVNTITVDGAVVVSRAQGKKQKPELPYVENSDGPVDTRTIGVALSIPPGAQKQLRIMYTRGTRLIFGKGGGYLDTLWYKHPGISDMSLRTIIRYPIYWIASNEGLISSQTRQLSNHNKQLSTGTFVAKEGEFEYNNQVSEDSHIRFKFIK